MTHNRTEVKRLLAEAGVSPRKSLGQNFVTDPNTVHRIARLAEIGPGSNVVEIGAGLGSLTLALRQAGANVLAIETDAKLVDALKKVLRHSTCEAKSRTEAKPHSEPRPGIATVLHADARRLDWDAILSQYHGANESQDDWHLVANLPYNIATSLVLAVLDEAPKIKHLLVMCQREAAERLVADAGDSSYGAVSVRVRMQGAAKIVGAVPATVFWPEPAVESALVRVIRNDTVLPEPLTIAVRTLLRQTFGRRRKMLRRSLRGGELDIDADTAQTWLMAAGIAEVARPEQLGLDEWLALGEVLCATRKPVIAK